MPKTKMPKTKKRVMFFDLDLTDVDPPPGECDPIPRRVGEVKLTNVRSILSWVINGDLVHYVNNRGDGRYDKKTVALAYQGVDSDVIGECPIAISERQMCLTDWQSRLYGFLLRYIELGMTKRELDTVVCCRVARDFIKTYREINRQGQGHKTRDKLRNPDLAFGAVWHKVKDYLSPGCISLIGDGRWTVVSSLILAIQSMDRNSEEEWYWPDIYQLRMRTREFADNKAGDGVRLTRRQVADFSEAIMYWYDLMMALQEESGPVKITLIKKSAGFFGFIVADRLSADPLTGDNHKTVAKRLLRNIDKMNEVCPEMCRGTKMVIIKYCGVLQKILVGRSSRQERL